MSLHRALEAQDYPCDYPFKLICTPQAVEEVRARVLNTLGPGSLIKDVHQRASRGGRYIALTVTIEAIGAEQIESVYAALADVPGIVTSL